jgi:hypothetical protein
LKGRHELGAGEDPGPVPRNEPWREREAQLVQNPLMNHVGVQSWTTLEQYRPMTCPRQLVEGLSWVHAILAGDDEVGNPFGAAAHSGVAGACGHDEGASFGLGEKWRGPVEGSRTGDDSDRRNLRLSPSRSLPTQLVVEGRRAIGLGSRCPGTDEDDVRERSQDLEDATIGGPTEQTGSTIDGDRAVERRDHVAPYEWPFARAGRNGVRLDEVDFLRRPWQERPHVCSPVMTCQL